MGVPPTPFSGRKNYSPLLEVVNAVRKEISGTGNKRNDRTSKIKMVTIQ